MKKYKNSAVIYARLSSEDNSKDVSSSIINQIAICKDYAYKHNLFIEDVYIDDGYTGSNFNRPGFTKLIEDIKLNKISIVISKDLSRIGRNFIQTSYYIEDFFMKYNVRYISVNDNYDSINNQEEISLPIKNFINGYYSKQCSKKQLDYYTKNEKTKSFAKDGCYGYVMVNNKLIIDDKAADIVRLIFNRYVNGDKVTEIIKYLNDNKILNPADYKKTYLKTKFNYDVKTNKGLWTRDKIYSILKNRQYVGEIINRKKQVNTVSKRRFYNQNPSILYDDHEAIISIDIFNKAQEFLANKRKYKNVTDDLRLKRMIYSIDDKVYCYKHYMKNNKLYESYSLCDDSHKIKANIVHDIVYKDAVKVFKLILSDEDKFINRFIEKEKKKFTSKKIDDMKKEKSTLELKLKTIFEQYALQKITKTKYLQMIDGTKKKLASLTTIINEYSIEELLLKQKVKNLKDFIEEIKHAKDDSSKLDFIRMMVSKIIIIKDNKKIKFHIIYKFENTIK